jgi:hypothetical protein
MKQWLCLVSAWCTVMGALGISALPSDAKSVVLEDETDVIVIMRDQIAAAPAGRGMHSARASAIESSQTPILAELRRARASRIRGFGTINAVAATVSRSEAEILGADPRVQAVVADKVIRLRKPQRDVVRTASAAPAPAPAPAEANAAKSATSTDNSLCNTLEPQALQLTHTAYRDPATPQAQQVVDGMGHKVTGEGVTVAFIADGLDPTVLGFTRPDGSSVFVDYQDFSGDPAGTATEGGEAFGDASSVAAQDYPKGKLLTFDISSFIGPTYPTPQTPCKIQIRGMAPGASLMGLKIFSSLGYTTTSTYVQAIEYAVQHGVDVMNESIGGQYSPDDDNDPVILVNRAAVAAGVTVVVSSGDAGTTDTLGSPSTDSQVIEVGATTSYRIYAQTGNPGGAITSSHGYIDNNISPFSSGGFAQTRARTIDAVAPGDAGWALCSTDMSLYYECSTDAGNPTPIVPFAGTSESAPLVAGEAALIIQAYRSTHRGASPSPALIKNIIKTTAVDLFAPAFEQGSGLIDSLAAVHLAMSFRDTHGGAKPAAESVSFTPDSHRVTAATAEPEKATFSLTNHGAETHHVVPELQILGEPFAGSSVSLALNPATDPQFTNADGDKRAYTEHRFTVPKGAQHLDVAMTTQSSPSTFDLVDLVLLDPSGRLSNYSTPGYYSGYAHVEVVDPAPGTWTALIWTRLPSDPLSYSGPVEFTWSAEKYVNFGSVYPESLELQPGETARFTAHFSMPQEPGDSAATIRFSPDSGLRAAIPISLRTLIPIGATGGSFTGVVTGSNGGIPTQTYAFDVPPGLHDMSLTLNTADSGYLLAGVLVDPNGMQVSVVGNLDPAGESQYGMSLFRYNPQPGRWHFLLIQNYIISGNQTALPFTARIAFNAAQVSAPALPNSPDTKLSAAGKPVVVPIRVVNSAAVTEAFFADARLDTPVTTTLPVPPECGYFTGTSVTLFTTLPGDCGGITLPTQTKRVEFIAQSTVPITMDAYPLAGFFGFLTGAPDIYGKSIGKNMVAATLTEPEVPSGAWYIYPALIGPFGPAGAFNAPVNMSAKVSMLPFDPAVSADSGDVWADQVLGTQTFKPLILAPGAAGTINVTITPIHQQIGDVIKGSVFIDTYNLGIGAGDEVVRLPYSYTIAP